MHDLEEIDKKLYEKELKRQWPRFVLIAVFVLLAAIGWQEAPIPFIFVGLAAYTSWVAIHKARKSTQSKLFHNPYFELRWTECKDRVERFTAMMKTVPQTRSGTLTEIPKTIERVRDELYQTLRMADLIAHELHKSEGVQYTDPNSYSTAIRAHGYVPDQQSNELWVAADKNRAEYKKRLQGVQMSIVRSDAQVEVFITAMDALRLNLMGLKLTKKKDDGSSNALLTSLAEVKLQMASISAALDELDFGIYPTLVAVDGTRSGIDPILPSDSDENEKLDQPAGADQGNKDQTASRKQPPPFRPQNEDLPSGQ